MATVAKIKDDPPPDWYASWQRERAYSRKLEAQLDRAITLLAVETSRRELAGEDVAHIRAFIREARS